MDFVLGLGVTWEDLFGLAGLSLFLVLGLDTFWPWVLDVEAFGLMGVGPSGALPVPFAV